MTIQTTSNKILYTGDGVTVAFTYNFRVDRAEDMSVYIGDVLTESGWGIIGLGDPNGGTVTFDTAPVTDAEIALVREIELEQLVDYKPYDSFPAETHESALDKLTMIIQQLQEQLNRSLVANIQTPAGVDNSLPPYDAGKGIMWDEAEEKMANSNDNFNDIVTNAAASELSASNSAGAAATNANWAYLWAQAPEDNEVAAGEYSAYHWALKAAEWATGMPSGTRMIFQQAAVLLSWTLQNIGDCVLGVSNGTDKLYDGENPGAIGAGSFVNGGLGVTIAGHVITIAEMPAHIHRGRSIIWQNGSGEGGHYNWDTAQAFSDLINVETTGGGGAHGHVGSVVTDNGSGRPLAAVCHVAEKD